MDSVASNEISATHNPGPRQGAARAVSRAV